MEWLHLQRLLKIASVNNIVREDVFVLVIIRTIIKKDVAQKMLRDESVTLVKLSTLLCVCS